MGRYSTICQKADWGRRYEEVRVAAGVTIYPGMIFDIDANGEAVIATPNAGAASPTRLAIEDGLIGSTVDTAYTAGMLLRYVIPIPGEQYAVLVLDGSVVTNEGDLIAADNGLFKITTGSPSKVYFRAKEAYTPSGANKLVLAEAY